MLSHIDKYVEMCLLYCSNLWWFIIVIIIIIIIIVIVDWK